VVRGKSLQGGYSKGIGHLNRYQTQDYDVEGTERGRHGKSGLIGQEKEQGMDVAIVGSGSRYQVGGEQPTQPAAERNEEKRENTREKTSANFKRRKRKKKKARAGGMRRRASQGGGRQ